MPVFARGDIDNSGNDFNAISDESDEYVTPTKSGSPLSPLSPFSPMVEDMRVINDFLASDDFLGSPDKVIIHYETLGDLSIETLGDTQLKSDHFSVEFGDHNSLDLSFTPTTPTASDVVRSVLHVRGDGDITFEVQYVQTDGSGNSGAKKYRLRF